MKEIEAISGIILIIVGAIAFEMNWDSIIKVFGLALLIVGVIIYIVSVDSLDHIKKKRE